MEAIVSLLVFFQALGAIVGACTVVWGELAYVHAMRDGNIDTAERAHLRFIANGLRFGMLLLLLSSLGLVIAAYMLQAALQPALSTSYWILVALAFIIIGVSWALSRRRISFPFGSAILFAGWWFLAYLVFGIFPPLSFGTVIAFFIVATAIFYAILQSARFLFLRDRSKGATLQE
ncbi:MAG TPA: hypothetical protein VNF51_01970 [Candidatus Paceibacterota bacterium]|nr:hypothetical protein [Candidatus Paceibacterota bacterium]